MGASTSAGRFVRAITCAIVNVFPEPVTPSRTWSRSCWFTPSTSAAMASGWSPLGSNSETMSKRMPPSDFSGRAGLCGVHGLLSRRFGSPRSSKACSDSIVALALTMGCAFGLTRVGLSSPRRADNAGSMLVRSVGSKPEV